MSRISKKWMSSKLRLAIGTNKNPHNYHKIMMISQPKTSNIWDTKGKYPNYNSICLPHFSIAYIHVWYIYLHLQKKSTKFIGKQICLYLTIGFFLASSQQPIEVVNNGEAFFMLFADAMALAITGAWPLNMLMPEMPTWKRTAKTRTYEGVKKME